jgi:DNA-binding NtrC family response regulator
VILLDIRLGRCSGLELFRELRRADPEAAIIFITGHGTADTAYEAKNLGAYDYLVKPLDAIQLQHVVQRALAAPHSVPAPALKPKGRRRESRPIEG